MKGLVRLAALSLGWSSATFAEAAEPSPRSDAVAVGGYVQVDWVVHRQSSQDELDPATREPLNEDRFVLRRSRAQLGVDSGYVGARLVLDANTVRALNVRPFEAVLLARFPASLDPDQLSAAAPTLRSGQPTPGSDFAAAFSVGLMPVPFGFDGVEGDLARPWLERALGTRALFGLGRDLGLGLNLGYRFARLSVALQNGQPIADDRYAGRDLTRRKDVVARVGVSVPVAGSIWLQAGVSYLLGQGLHLGTPATKDSLAWVDGNEDGLVAVSELTPIAGAPATPSQSFDRSALGGDVRLGVELPILGELALRAELTRAINLDRTVVPADPIATGRSLRELCAHVGLAQQLTRFGELALRYEVYNPDADGRRQRAAAVVPSDPSYRTFSVAVAGKLAPARVVVQLDHNDNALGRTSSGAPTRLRDDALTVRFEGRFP
jgi:hypothetical protein